MIIQTAPSGTPRLAIMMYEHNALCLQLAHAFGNGRFEPLSPADLMIHVISHHDAGWIDFDRNPKIDPATGLPYNLVDTPPEFITTTSRLSPDFNQRQHPYCGLISSMHSWGLYNGRYGLSKLVLLDKIAAKDRPLADKMLNGELERQKRLKAELATDPEARAWLDERKIFQNYKALQFIDTLALYFNRIHPSERVEQAFENVPLSPEQDVTITHTSGRSEHLPSVSVSVRRQRGGVRVLRTPCHSGRWRQARRLAGRVEGTSDRMGVLPAGGMAEKCHDGNRYSGGLVRARRDVRNL